MSNTSLLGSFGGQAGDALMFRNRIVNGCMRIDQRNAGAAVTPANATYTLDRFVCNLSQPSKYSVQQSLIAPSSFSNSMLFTSLSAYSVLATDNFQFEQRIEGFNFSDMAWGTSNAQTITLSFWVRSSLTGTFGGSLRNSAGDRSYPFSYSISAANTWEQKAITILGDTTGTWIGGTTGIGLRVGFGLGVGSNFSGTAGSWSGSNLLSVTGATSVVGTSGATLYITGVQLEAGPTATPFERRPIGVETMLCKRYCHVVVATGASFLGISKGTGGTSTDCWIYFPTTMRPGTMTYASTATITFTPYAYVTGTMATATTSAPSINFFDTNKCLLSVSGHGAISGGTGVSMDASGGNIIFSVEL